MGEVGCLFDEIGNLVEPTERRHKEVPAGPQRGRSRSVAERTARPSENTIEIKLSCRSAVPLVMDAPNPYVHYSESQWLSRKLFRAGKQELTAARWMQRWSRDLNVGGGVRRIAGLRTAPYPTDIRLRHCRQTLPQGRGNGRKSRRRVEVTPLTRRRRASTGVRRIRRTPRHDVAAGPQAKQDSEAQRCEQPGQTKDIRLRDRSLNSIERGRSKMCSTVTGQ